MRLDEHTAPNMTEEETRVLLWRTEQCLRAGYSAGEAATIALDTTIDLEQARKLRRLGCPSDLAMRVLV
jgi:malonyl CoA-acyl carrier protein transacylase